MPSKSCNLALLLAALCLLGGQETHAQTAAPTPVACNETQSMNFDADQLSGIWWEVARNPSSPSPYACVQVNFTVMPDNVMSIATTFSNTPAYLWVNQTMYANVTLPDVTSDSSGENDGGTTPTAPLAVNQCDVAVGCNVSYTLGHFVMMPTVFKLLDTDYKNYALICGYSNVTNNNTFYGIVLTRDRTPTTAVLDSYEATASEQYEEFHNGTMSLVTQTPMCYASAAVNYLQTIFNVFVFLLITVLFGA